MPSITLRRCRSTQQTPIPNDAPGALAPRARAPARVCSRLRTSLRRVAPTPAAGIPAQTQTSMRTLTRDSITLRRRPRPAAALRAVELDVGVGSGKRETTWPQGLHAAAARPPPGGRAAEGVSNHFCAAAVRPRAGGGLTQNHRPQGPLNPWPSRGPASGAAAAGLALAPSVHNEAASAPPLRPRTAGA